MNDTQLSDRVAILERDNRRWKRICIAGFSLVLATIAIGAAAVPEVLEELRVKRLVVVDGEKRDRIVIDGKDGKALQILGENGTPIVRLHADSRTRAFTLLDNDGAIRARLAIDTKTRVSTLDLRGKNRKLIAVKF